MRDWRNFSIYPGGAAAWLHGWARQSHSWLDLILAVVPLWPGVKTRRLSQTTLLWVGDTLLRWCSRESATEPQTVTSGMLWDMFILTKHLLTTYSLKKGAWGYAFQMSGSSKGKLLCKGRGTRSSRQQQGRQDLWPPKQEVREFRQPGSRSGPGTVVRVSLSPVSAL